MKTLLTLVLFALFAAGCGNSEPPPSQQSRFSAGHEKPADETPVRQAGENTRLFGHQLDNLNEAKEVGAFAAQSDRRKAQALKDAGY